MYTDVHCCTLVKTFFTLLYTGEQCTAGTRVSVVVSLIQKRNVGGGITGGPSSRGAAC